jgi:hypothetical protein
VVVPGAVVVKLFLTFQGGNRTKVIDTPQSLNSEKRLYSPPKGGVKSLHVEVEKWKFRSQIVTTSNPELGGNLILKRASK